MNSNCLAIINKKISEVVPYEFMRWTGIVQYPYAVGEYMETPATTEDWGIEGTMIVTVTTKGTWAELEEIKRRIEMLFDPLNGLRQSTYYGSVAIYFENGFPVPTGEADLKRMQINLRIKQWKTFGGK